MKNVRIKDFLTDAQVDECLALANTTPHHEYAKVVCERVIKPNLAEINRKLGQENDPKYLAYAIEYAVLHDDLRKLN